MQKIIVFIIFIQSSGFLHSQEINSRYMKEEVEIEIPKDYLTFKGTDLQKNVEIKFNWNNWSIWSLETAISKTMELRKSGAILDTYFAFASDTNNQILYFKNVKNLRAKIYHLDEDFNSVFYAYSFTEILNYEKTQKLILEIDSVGFENQSLTEIEKCPGSMYNYAFQLSSEYGVNNSKKRYKRALEMFYELAEKEHPEAAHEIANHFYYQDRVKINKVIEWREKAIEFGSKEDIYELADFLIDNKPEEIDKAILLLESLLEDKLNKKKALLKLGRIYVRETEGKLNLKLGISYLEQGVELGHSQAMADLAYYYYHGRGVKKNVQKAYDLLKEAERLAIEKTGSGWWKEFIEMLEKELKEGKN